MSKDINKGEQKTPEERIEELEKEMGELLEEIKGMREDRKKDWDEFKQMWIDMNDRINGELTKIHEAISKSFKG